MGDDVVHLTMTAQGNTLFLNIEETEEPVIAFPSVGTIVENPPDNFFVRGVLPGMQMVWRMAHDHQRVLARADILSASEDGGLRYQLTMVN